LISFRLLFHPLVNATTTTTTTTDGRGKNKISICFYCVIMKLFTNKQNAQLVYYSPGAGDLGGTITEDGSIDGFNLLGRSIMKLA
jgi:hypothetical protein